MARVAQPKMRIESGAFVDIEYNADGSFQYLPKSYRRSEKPQTTANAKVQSKFTNASGNVRMSSPGGRLGTLQMSHDLAKMSMTSRKMINQDDDDEGAFAIKGASSMKINASHMDQALRSRSNSRSAKIQMSATTQKHEKPLVFTSVVEDGQIDNVSITNGFKSVIQVDKVHDAQKRKGKTQSEKLVIIHDPTTESTKTTVHKQMEDLKLEEFTKLNE